MRRKRNNKPIIVLLILLILAASLLAGMAWFISTHFFLGGKAYANNARSLDLRDQNMTIARYDAIREKLPECDIRWDIPFQNSTYPDDTASLSVSSLSDADLNVLAYFENLKEVDASGCRDYAQLQKLQQMYPELKLNYTVIIDGQEYPWDADTVVCSALTDADIEMMAMLPELKTVDASGCRDYGKIGQIAAVCPDAEISYQVELMGKTFTDADISATFTDPDVDMLLEKLAWMPHMEKVHLEEPQASADKLRQLIETYPDITFTWNKTVLGKTFNSAQTEYDLAGTVLDSVTYAEWAKPVSAEDTAAVLRKAQEAMAYFPNAEKVIFPAHYYHNETMAAFREEMRPEYKTVWYVHITKKPVRTDQEVIHSSAMQVCLIDEQSQDLYYCEDAIVCDIGHSYVKNIEWVKGMPKLKYLILTHNWVKDLTPISTCKNMVYLEIYWNDHIPDYSPLVECTSLVDLNLSGSYADLEPIKQMTWLENLWATCRGVSESEYRELCEALPNTKIEYRGGDYTSYGWREVQGYFDMRDIMGLPYNHW